MEGQFDHLSIYPLVKYSNYLSINFSPHQKTIQISYPLLLANTS